MPVDHPLRAIFDRKARYGQPPRGAMIGAAPTMTGSGSPTQASQTAIGSGTHTAPGLSIVGSVTDVLLDRVGSALIVDGTEVYLGSSPNDRFVVCDVSNPASPSVIASVTSSSKVDNVSGLAMYGNYLLVLSPIDSQVYVYDMSTPSSPSDIGSNYISSTQIANASAIAVSGNYAFVLGSPSGDDRFVVLDLTTIAPGVGPTFVTSITDSRFNLTKQLTIAGTTAYATSDPEDRLTVVDISTPGSPSILGSLQDLSNMNAANGVVVDGSVAYVTNTSSPPGLSTIDVSTPSSPTLLDNIAVTGAGFLAKIGDMAFVTDAGNDTVRSVDVSDPSNLALGPTLTDSTYLDGVTNIVTDGTYLYCACFNADRLTILEYA